MEVHHKIVIIGDSGVGKTTIANKATGSEINENHVPTIGAAYSILKIDVNDKLIYLDLWDTAGQELYRSLVPNYARGANGAILVFDVTVESSFDNLNEWLDYLRDNCDEFPIIVFGNKTDLKHKRIVLQDQAQEFCESHGIEYLEGSALDGFGINDLFAKVAKLAEENNTHSAPVKINVCEKDTAQRLCPC